MLPVWVTKMSSVYKTKIPGTYAGSSASRRLLGSTGFGITWFDGGCSYTSVFRPLAGVYVRSAQTGSNLGAGLWHARRKLSSLYVPPMYIWRRGIR